MHGGMKGWRHEGMEAWWDGGMNLMSWGCPKAASARTAMAKIFRTKDISSSDKLLMEAKSANKRLTGLDPHWRLENAMVQMIAGPAAEQRLLDRVLQVMPSKERAVTPGQALEGMEKMAVEDIIKLAPEGAQRQLKLCIAFVKTLQSTGIRDLKNHDKATLVKAVQEAAENFMRVEGPAKAILVGRDAMTLHYKTVHPKFAKGEATAGDIEQLRRFLWLVPAEHKSAVDELLVEHDKVSAAKVKVMKGGDKKSKSKSSSSSDAATKAALEMFSV